MSKRIKVADLPEFDAAHYLDSKTSIAAYLTDILKTNDASFLASALGDIARARGMTEIAKTAGITREALYKALRPDSAPRFDTGQPGMRRSWCASRRSAGPSNNRHSLKSRSSLECHSRASRVPSPR